MKSYFLLFSFALLVTLLVTPLVRQLALRWGAVDLPDGLRRIHKTPTARLGGVGIFLTFAFTLACVPLLNNLVSQGLLNGWQRLSDLILPATIIFLLGVYDDFRGLNAPVKTGIQVLAALILYLEGYSINALSLPFESQLQLPFWLSFPLTALWIVGITNAFNLIDGIDGLAGGASVFALLSLFITSLLRGHTEICVVSIILVGSVMGFLRYNFNPASIFLGDSGSLFLGFMCATLSLISAQKSSTIIAVAIPLVSFGLPVLEVGLSMSRRFLRGDPIFQSDRRHIHHMLLERGFNQRQVVILLYGVCALFSLFGIMLLSQQRSMIALIFALVGACIVLGVQHLRYDEFNVLSEQLRHGIRIRRRALAVDLQLRQAATELHEVTQYNDLSLALNRLFATSEFDCVLLEIYSRPMPQQAVPANTLEGIATVGAVHSVMPTTSLGLSRNGPNCVEWSWNWQNDKIQLVEVLTSPHFWSLRIPLSGSKGQALGAITFFRHVVAGDLAVDLTKICGGLRDELSAAIERLEQQAALDETAPLVALRPAQLSYLRS